MGTQLTCRWAGVDIYICDKNHNGPFQTATHYFSKTE